MEPAPPFDFGGRMLVQRMADARRRAEAGPPPPWAVTDLPMGSAGDGPPLDGRRAPQWV